MKRLAECVGANNVQIRRYVKNRKAQQWFFDPVTKTLKNNNWKNYSLHIQGTNVRCQPTSSRWW
jgi:L-rhamnose mutarotase